MSSAVLLQLIDKTSDWDKDERYMAANDLCNLLARDIKIDEHIEQKICTAILKLLDDSSNDVQSVAVKCLAVLVKKVHAQHIGDIGKKLSDLIVEGNAALRDIYSIGLKTLINDVPESMGPQLCSTLSAKLLGGAIQGGKQSSDDVRRECLENMFELLKRFGHIVSNHSSIVAAMLDSLKSPKAPLRKRATNCLGALAVVSNDAVLNELVSVLLNRIQELNSSSAGTSQESRTLIQTIGNISRNVGYRLGRYLGQIVPLFVTFCGDPDNEDGHNEASNDLRESCFPGLESFVLRCPKEVVPHLEAIVHVSLAFLKYDPNYSYGSDAEEDAYEEEDYGDEDYGGSEDDDGSWKVRKAAIKVIDAVVTTHAARLAPFHARIQDELLSRFKEREENVKIDVIKCFDHLLTVSAHSKSVIQTDKVVFNSLTQLQGKLVKVKTEVLSMLKNLIAVRNGGVETHLPKLLGVAEKFLRDKHQALKLETLQFLRVAYSHHDPTHLQPAIASLLPLTLQSVRDDWYKTIAEALRLTAVFVQTMRPSVQIEQDDATAMDVAPFDFEPHILDIYDTIMAKLSVNDVDLEIKECSIHAMGICVAYFGDRLSSALVEGAFVVFQKRIENESSRLITLRSVRIIAKSSLSINLTSFVHSSAQQLAFFCKQYSRALKTLTLTTLTAIADNAATVLDDALLDMVVKEVGPLISDVDLFVAYLANSLVLSLFVKNSTVATPLIAAHVYNRLIALATSSLTQGQALDSLIQLLKALVSSDSLSFTFQEVFDRLNAASAGLTGEVNKQCLSNVSKCIAGICAVIPQERLRETMRSFAKDIDQNAHSEAQRARLVLALLSMGEVGQSADLSHIDGLAELLLRCFEHPAEDVKHAAAYALGHVTIGNMAAFLPLVLASLSQSNQVRIQYLLLLSLKENILLYSAHPGTNYDGYIDQMLPILLALTSHEDDSIRNILSDCLGTLTAVSLPKLLPALTGLYARGTDSKLHLWIVASALKSCFVRPLSEEQLTQLSAALPAFFPLLHSADLDVKKAALLMVNTAIHHNPRVVLGHIHSAVYPVLMDTLLVKLERVVDLGPFKHKVDDNLPLRKICLACLDTVLNVAPEHFDTSAVMHVSAQLLADQDDVKLLFLQILPRVCEVNGSAVAVHIDGMVPGLENTLSKAFKDTESMSSSKEILKAVVRLVFRADAVEDVRQVGRRWGEFSAKVRKAESIAEIVRSVELESSEQV